MISSLEVGISPVNIDFYISQNEVLCKKIILFSDEKISFYGEDRWSNSINSKDLSKYIKNSTDFNITLTYTKELKVDGNEEIRVCIKASDPGYYSGVLIYNTNEKASVGVWVSARVKGERKNVNLNSTQPLFSLTGLSIEKNSFNLALTFFSFISSLLLFILLILLIVYSRNRTEVV